MKHEVTEGGVLFYGLSMMVLGYLLGRMHALAPPRTPKPRPKRHTRQHHR